MSRHEASTPDSGPCQIPGVSAIVTPRVNDIDGLAVRRLLPSLARRSVGPFIFFDHMGPTTLEAGDEGLQVRPHPHINLATVTYLFEGEIIHRDSLGVTQAIRPGAINWMTAGRGIVHSERSPDAAASTATTLHGIQLWLGLPVADEETDPAFHHHPAASLPTVELPGAKLRVMIGSAYGARAPVETFSPTFYVEAQLEAGATISLPDAYSERALYLAEGHISVDGHAIHEPRLLVFEADAAPDIRADANARVLLLGGEPLDGERRHMWWNFVSSRRDRIERAKADWKAGRFPAVPGEDDFIPLPE